MEAETSILGFNHAEVGAKVGEKWNLPRPLVEAIANHHSPEQATIDPRLTAIIHLADCLTMIMGVGLGVDGLFYPMQESALETLGLPMSTLEELVSRLTDMMIDATAFLG